MSKRKEKKTVWSQYKTLEIIPYTDFFYYLVRNNKVFVYEGYLDFSTNSSHNEYEIKDIIINVDKPRMQTHITKSNVCTCGLETTHFAIQIGAKQILPHINAWHINGELSTPILMTSDHIIPLNKGGSDDISNRQVLCMKCNMDKGDKLIGIHDIHSSS